ncbi:MAG: hypothetical protein ACRDPV_10125 [Gaiellaceae bacterium]
MAGYTKLNLKADVDDQAVSVGLAPNLEFRVPGSSLDAEESALSYLRIAPGFRLPFGHSHERQRTSAENRLATTRVRNHPR